jgi:hypothetical protein
MSWWNELKDDASEFFTSGHWGKPDEDQDPVKVPMKNKAQQIEDAMGADIELQRAKQDLQMAEQDHAKAKQALSEAERASSANRDQAYVTEYGQAEAAMKSAKVAYDSAEANEKKEDKAKVDALYHKWRAACAKHDTLATRQLWDEKNPLDKFVPHFVKEEEERTHHTLVKMEDRKRQVEAAARQRAEAKVGQQALAQ